jgi:hypothetical protein
LAVKIADVRRLALALPEATEAPHFDRTSFRVRDKIFATVDPDGAGMNVFVADEQREIMVKVDPKAYETRMWGKSGYLHVRLAKAKPGDVETLLRSAWERKAPKKLVAQS